MSVVLFFSVLVGTLLAYRMVVYNDLKDTLPRLLTSKLMRFMVLLGVIASLLVVVVDLILYNYTLELDRVVAALLLPVFLGMGVVTFQTGGSSRSS